VYVYVCVSVCYKDSTSLFSFLCVYTLEGDAF
jgi:hypothetical protein